MTPERWRQVDQLLQAALSRPLAERAAFLAEACAGDEDLRREVSSLLPFHLTSHQDDDFLEALPAAWRPRSWPGRMSWPGGLSAITRSSAGWARAGWGSFTWLATLGSDAWSPSSCCYQNSRKTRNECAVFS